MSLLVFLLTIISIMAQTTAVPEEGDGSPENPFQIETWQNLVWISENQSEWSKNFVQTADISFDLVRAERVKITIYNVKGQIVKDLLEDSFPEGSYSVIWNGFDNQNKACATGVYFCKMVAGKSIQTKKMMMIK